LAPIERRTAPSGGSLGEGEAGRGEGAEIIDIKLPLIYNLSLITRLKNIFHILVSPGPRKVNIR
jgi:hypothetical protein